MVNEVINPVPNKNLCTWSCLPESCCSDTKLKENPERSPKTKNLIKIFNKDRKDFEPSDIISGSKKNTTKIPMGTFDAPGVGTANKTANKLGPKVFSLDSGCRKIVT